MVDCQVVPTVTTVLASVIVSMQKITTRETDFFVWDFDVGAKANYSRQRKVCINKLASVLYLFGFAIEQKQNCAAPTADVERFV